MYQKLEECPSCKHTKFDNYLICNDYSITNESFALVRCTKCELIFTNPRPDENSISSYYNSENYISHKNKGNNLINTLYKLVRNLSLYRKFKLLKKLSEGKTILDFGCGTGHFLAYLAKKGYNTYGIELNSDAKEEAIKRSNSTVETNLIDIKEKFDIITAWHSIEHVSDLRNTLKLLRKRLKKDGVLLIALPNINSFDSKHYREYWAGLDVPRHLYHFTKNSLSYLAKKIKLTLIVNYPLKFDSYYVSMLSEKYKNKKINYIKALKIGYKSNQKAKFNGEYSSIIYVFKK